MGTFNLMICEDLQNKYETNVKNIEDITQVSEALKDMHILDNFTDKNLISLYHHRVRCLDDGLDEKEYLQRRYYKTFGIRPEKYILNINKFEKK